MNKKFIQEYFSFSTKEKRGITALLVVLFIIISLNIYLLYREENIRLDFSLFEEEIDKFFSSEHKDEPQQELAMKKFDPNTATKTELLNLGLNNRVVNNIIRYRERGGRFENPENLSIIYGLSDEEFNRIKEYIVIERTKPEKPSAQTTYDDDLPEMFYFNPNKASEQELLMLGLTQRVVNNIIRYRNSGGEFDKAEDLKIIYGLSNTAYKRIKPFVKIETPEVAIEKTKQDEEKVEIDSYFLPIEINSADKNELQGLQGIGEVFSKRIVTYRSRLGGFYDICQLNEVYGIDEDLVTGLSDYITINTEKISKINLNNAEYRDIISHPYIDRQTTVAIMEYKRFAGHINDLQELLDQRVVSPEVYRKIKWYFCAQ